MKWGKSGRLDYSKIALILFILALVLLLVMMFSLLAPRQATAGDIVNFRTARRLASVRLSSDKVTTRASEPIAILICTVTAYSPTVQECDASPLVTASGKRVYVGGIAADLSVFPFGTILQIPGYNGGKPCTVIDTGSLIRGKTLDVFMWSSEDARQWGRRRNVEVRVLYVPKGKR